MLEHLLNIAVRSIFMENMALAFFLGMCSFLAVSKKVSTALGLGIAVTFVMTITSFINSLLSIYILKPGSMSWLHSSLASLDFSSLTFLAYIGTIAAMTQVVEMFLDKYVPSLYAALGVFLPLIAVNCAILGGALFIDQRNYRPHEAIVYGFSSGLGWLLAIIAMAGIREKLEYHDIPQGLRGLPIVFIIAGLMAMGFMAFGGIEL